MNVEIITIGDEILQGQIIDTNSAWIAQQLLPLHIRVVQITSIPDRAEVIRHALDDAKSRAELILVTGGLGPTKDDVTKSTVAAYFNTRLVRNEQVLHHVRELFKRMNKDMPKINEAQADVLENGEILFNEYGTAPGLWIEEDGKCFAFLPGVPYEMKYLIETRILPKIQHFHSRQKLVNRYILTVGLGESHLATQIADIEDELPPYIKLAFLPKIGIVRLRLTGSGEGDIEQEVDGFVDRIAQRLRDHVVAREDISFEAALVRKMTEQTWTLATAESCTGGNIAKRVAEINGASSMFKGGIVAYHNDIKVNLLGVGQRSLDHHGAVSEQVVKEMAIGAQRTLQTDFAVATSGIAGPSGGTAEKPVGTVWVAVASPTDVFAKKFHFHQDRLLNIERATSQAFLLLWQQIRRHLSPD